MDVTPLNAGYGRNRLERAIVAFPKLVVDGTTDRRVIEQWMGSHHRDARLVTVERNTTKETSRVFGALLESATSA